MALLNKQKYHLKKMENRKAKQVQYEGWYQWEEGGDRERVQEGEYCAHTMQSCIKMEKLFGNGGRG
jgi:hypothetical protein